MSIFDDIVYKTKKVTRQASKKIKEVAKNINESIGNSSTNNTTKIDNRNNVIEMNSSSYLLRELEQDSGQYRDFINELPDTPTTLTNQTCKKIKNLFPIPIEQEIFWADCEFDSRCSGIVCTNKGVFIKSNVKISDEKKNKENCKSILHYYSWSKFDPLYFSSKSSKNPILTVDVRCQTNFASACHKYGLKIEEQRENDLRLEEMELHNFTNIGIDASILAGANFMSSNQAIFAEKNASVNTTSGHGFMAEDMITRLDHIHGINSKVVGGDNAKNGADRYIDRLIRSDIKVQTKYYKTWRGSLDAGFDAKTGSYRYVSSDGTPMQLEVPKDQYKQVVEGFKKKISAGKFKDSKGNILSNNPNDAKKYVRKGRLTYQEAVNLTKPGTIESLKYDALTGVVTCSFAFGLSFVTSTYFAYKQTGDLSLALKEGLNSSIKVCGLAFANHMIISQFSRTNLAKSFVNASNKNFSRLLRNNIITSGITILVYSTPDMIRMFQNKISVSQFVKNTAILTGGVVGGAAGAVALGSLAKSIGGEKLGVLGGIVGGVAGGLLGSKITKDGADAIKEDDEQIFMRVFNAYMSTMVSEYFLDEKEIDKFIKLISSRNPKEIKQLCYDYRRSMYQENTIRNYLTPFFDSIANERKKFIMPQTNEVAKIVLEVCTV